MSLSPKKYGRTLLAFILVLALFLVGLDSFFFLREQRKHDLEQDENVRHELELIGAFVAEPMLYQEFGKVEQFLLQWGRGTPEVVVFHAFFPNGQTLAEFERDLPAGDILTASMPVYFEGQHLLTLEVGKDRSLFDAPLVRLKRNMVFFSLMITIFIGMVLWFLLRFMAIRPLELEIGLRRQVEGELQRSHDLLETRVAERTRELTVAVEGLHREMGERYRVERELVAEKERLVVTLRSIGDGVISTDIAGRVILINKAAERLTGWEQYEAVGRPLAEIFRLLDSKTRSLLESPVARVLRNGQVSRLNGKVLLVARNGVEREVADSAAPIRNEHREMVGAVLVFRDETEKNRMVEDRLKVRKLESVGMLAGGIAHDFNNILAAILGNIDLALRLPSGDKGIISLLESAKQASQRASKLTGQLLTFARGGEPIRQLAAIGEVIRDSAEFILRGSNVRSDCQIAEDLWPVLVDPGQISQVIQNIILNAAHAMPDGGVVEISCHNVHEEGGEEAGEEEAGDYVSIVIRDHGVGIPAPLLDSIFDPYFTTKEKGHGLGLAVTYSIVAKHGGRITVESEDGRGSTFTVFLPASPRGKISAEPVVGVQNARRQAKIMVMDDDEMIIGLASSILNYLGYTVIPAADGREAIRLYREHRDAGAPIDLVVLDLTVPGGMGGRETLKELLTCDPKVKAIVASGYSNDPVMANCREYGFVGMLSKPFTIRELSVEIDRVLTAPS